MRLAVVEIDHVGDDDSDVVGTAAAQCQLDEPVGALVVRALPHGVGDRLVADDVGQAVGAHEITVAGAGLAHGERRFDSLPVSARMINDRCGCVCACSGVMRPSSTSDCTKVSSRVIWVS